MLVISVHPHVCGAYEAALSNLLQFNRFIPTCVGRTDRHLTGSQQLIRFIPTCVGRTDGHHGHIHCADGSSPRVWGVLLAGLILSAGLHGSSPRVWGVLRPCQLFLEIRPVHPHVCGAYWSSVLWLAIPVRFIPTCVGRT